MVGTLVMAPKSVTFRRHDHLVSVFFGDLLSHSYNITFSMFLYLVTRLVQSPNNLGMTRKKLKYIFCWNNFVLTKLLPFVNDHSPKCLLRISDCAALTLYHFEYASLTCFDRGTKITKITTPWKAAKMVKM